MEVGDLILTRTQRWQQSVQGEPPRLPAPGETRESGLARYAIVGAIFEGERQVRANTLWLADLMLHSASMAASVTRPVTNSWLMTPLRRPFPEIWPLGK